MAAHHQTELADAMRGWERATGVGAALKKLPDGLRDSEKLGNLDRAQQGSRTGLLAVTDERVLFVTVGILRELDIDDYAYNEIKRVHVETHRFGLSAKLVLDLPADRITFTNLDRVRAERIADWVHERLGSQPRVRVPGDRTITEAITQLKASIGKAQALVALPGLRRIAQTLERAEEIGPGLVGTLGNSPGVLITTNRRLIFASYDPRRPLDEWWYNHVDAVDVDRARKMWALTITTHDGAVVVATPAKARASSVAEHVTPRIGATPPPPPPPPPPKPSASPPAPPLDVNAADDSALHDIGLSPAQTALVLACRNDRGPFRSVDDFLALLNLQPHETVKVRKRIVVKGAGPPSPPPPPPDETSAPGDWEIT